MHIGLSYWVDKPRGERMVGIGKGIRISSREKELSISLTLLTSITSSVMDVSHSLRGAVIGNITGSVMDIGRSLRRAINSNMNIWFSYRVDQASVKSIVSQGEPSIWESIRIGTQAIPVRKNNRGSCIL